ncbi:hypothetical protein Sste5346_002864 [Sporothrix stenoceras]|uniref:Cas1p 10 TM acyl transferase domain-containing protein n=1 Tax=Sporothrix stenoceras TaxID=5173 RepID=A0ABR3ZFI0_9PEZI
MRPLRLVAGTAYSLLDVSHGIANIVIRLSLALFCFGLILQALSNAADPYRCGALIRHGSWPPYTPPKVDIAADYEQLETLQREGREPPPARPFDKWEPASCRMHEYSRDDIRDCLGGKRVLFVGDSTMRVLFFAALTRLEHEAAEWLLRMTFTEANPRHDLAIDSETVQLQFIWDPWLNSTAFEEEIRLMEPGGDKGVDPASKPDLVIMGSVGLWAARNAGDDMYFDTFRTTTDRVSRAMSSEVRPFGKHQSDNYVFLAPVTIPRYEMLLPGRVGSFSPERIKRMNNYLGSLSPTVQSHILTSYNDMTKHIPEAYEDTGLHVTASVAERWIDVPLNARCNGLLLGRPAADQSAPSLAHTTTCCATYPTPVRGQKALWLVFTGPSTNGNRAFGARARANTANGHSHISPPDDVNVRNAVSQDAGRLDRVLIAILYPDEFTAPLQTMIVIFSSVFFLGYASATSVWPIFDGETSHPYLTSVAVVCFAVIRNCHGQLRAKYMVLPAALGAMALELFVLHSHILLSGNGTGHLRLLSIYPSAVEEGASFLENLTNVKVATIHCLEIVSITTVFLLVSQRAHKSTRLLSSILFGKSPTGNADVPLSAKNTDTATSRLVAFDKEHYELPQYGDGTMSTAAAEEPAKRPGPSGSATKIRAASILILLWGFNRYYL